jgi:hypothetical protein
VLAEIASNALQQQLELSLQGFQYKNTLVEAKVNQQNTINSRYDNKYQDVLNQINTEKALAEQVRQFNAQLEEEKRQYNESLALQKQQMAISASRSSGGGSSSSGSSGSTTSKKASGSTTSNKAVEIASSSSSKVGNGKVATAYYQGAINKDANKYGTFDNGYQPKGITGHGEVSKTGEKVKLQTSPVYGSNAGQKQTLIQNVWVAKDGTKWYWEGRENKYKQLK